MESMARKQKRSVYFVKGPLSLQGQILKALILEVPF